VLLEPKSGGARLKNFFRRFAPVRCPHFCSGPVPPTFKFVPAPLGSHEISSDTLSVDTLICESHLSQVAALVDSWSMVLSYKVWNLPLQTLPRCSLYARSFVRSQHQAEVFFHFISYSPVRVRTSLFETVFPRKRPSMIVLHHLLPVVSSL